MCIISLHLKAIKMKKQQANYLGGCLCGAVRYVVSAFEPLIGHCHCKMCQKFHGAAFSTYAEVKLSNLDWLCGVAHLKAYKAENKSIRQFCDCCGSSISFCSVYNQQARSIELALASLDNSRGLIPDAHIYTGSKAPWLKLNDGLPQHSQYRDSDRNS